MFFNAMKERECKDEAKCEILDGNNKQKNMAEVNYMFICILL